MIEGFRVEEGREMGICRNYVRGPVKHLGDLAVWVDGYEQGERAGAYLSGEAFA